MTSTLLDERDGLRTYALVLQADDEAAKALAGFAAIGAFSHAIVAYFDWTTKGYRHIRIDEQVEVFSPVGDISLEDGVSSA
jgi:predicted DNA-binding protein with PD1-like motif